MKEKIYIEIKGKKETEKTNKYPNRKKRKERIRKTKTKTKQKKKT